MLSSNTAKTRRNRTAQRGLTLLEMLVTVSILAAVAAIGLQVLRGVDRDSKLRLAQAEMAQIAQAIRRFEQDSGYRARIVGYNNTALGQCGARANGADFYFLFEPGGCSQWNLESSSGWNGPYLSAGKRRRAQTDVGADGNVGNDVEVLGLHDGLQTARDNSVFDLPNGSDNLSWLNPQAGANSWPYVFYSETDFNSGNGFRHLRASGLDRELAPIGSFYSDECETADDSGIADSGDQILCF